MPPQEIGQSKTIANEPTKAPVLAELLDVFEQIGNINEMISMLEDKVVAVSAPMPDDKEATTTSMPPKGLSGLAGELSRVNYELHHIGERLYGLRSRIEL